MASKIKVDQIEGSTGSSITIPTGQTLTITDGIAASTIGSGTLSSDRLPTVPVAKGGTGLTSLGTAGQTLKVNSGGTALEFATASAGNEPSFFAHMTTDQSGYAQGTSYDIPFNSEDWDTHNPLSVSNLDNYQFVCPTGQAGKYVFDGYILFLSAGGGNTNNDTYRVTLRKKPSGGSYSNYAVQENKQEPDINRQGLSFNFGLELAVGDAVNLQMYSDQGSGTYNVSGDSTLTTYWRGMKIGD